MSYVEQAFYGWVKSMLSDGLKVLTKKRFATYTFLVLALTVITTIISFFKGYIPIIYTLIFNLEIAVCASLVITGLISIKIGDLRKELFLFLVLTALFYFVSTFLAEVYITAFENLVVYSSFYVWVITVNIVTLISIRSIIVSWPGWVMRLGDPKERVVFAPIIKIVVVGSLGWFIYLLYIRKVFFLGIFGLLTAWAVLYAIFIFAKVLNEGNLPSILSIFYLYSLYHILVTTNAGITGFIVVDALLVLLTTIITAQGISGLLSKKRGLIPYHWDRLVMLVLGFALGYHILAVKIGFEGLGFLLSVYHDLSFGFCMLIIFGTLLLYWFNKPFRNFSKGEITPKSVLHNVVDIGTTAVIKTTKDIKKKLRKGFRMEFKKDNDK